MQKNSMKNMRINGEVQRELSNIIRSEVKDPSIAPMTGDEEAQNNTIKGLNSAEGYIRHALAKSINLRNTPEIRFILDQSIEYGVNMSKKIDEVIGQEES